MSIILAAGAARMKLEAENYEARISELEAHIAALEAQLAEAKAENARLREALTEIDALEVMEVNPSNYDHDDVCELNRNASYAAVVARAALTTGDAHE